MGKLTKFGIKKLSKIAIATLTTSLMLIPVTYAKNTELDLRGEAAQGGLLVGKTMASDVVRINDKEIPVSAEGYYVFGFGRDDTKAVELTVISQDGDKLVKSITPSKRDYNIQRIEGIKKSIMQPDPVAIARAKKTANKLKPLVKFRVI